MKYAEGFLDFLSKFLPLPIISFIALIMVFIIAFPRIDKGATRAWTKLIRGIYGYNFNQILNWEDYLYSIRKAYSKTRSIVNPTHEMDFYDIYVSPPFSFKSRNSSQKNIKLSTQHIADDLHKDRAKILLISDAGSGKSMASQDVFLKIIEHNKKIPIFFPLHYINGRPHKEYALISKFVYDRFFSAIPNFSLATFYEMERKGKFIYILDGYDEVDFRIVPHFFPILDTWYLNQKCGILLSTRPGTKLFTLAESESYTMSPFGPKEIRNLIIKFKKIAPKKALLLEAALRKGLLTAPDEFMSNPLLATVLLLGVKEGNKSFNISDIFDNAFFALYKRHDRYKREEVKRMHKVQKITNKMEIKSAYERKVNNLTYDEFEEILANFAWQVWKEGSRYADQKSSEKILKSAINSFETKINIDELLIDLQISLPVLVERDYGIEFIHKSFLEYFVALYYIKYWSYDISKELFKELQNYENQLKSDQVLKFMQEMSPDDFNSGYMAPRINLMIQKLTKTKKKHQSKAAITIFFENLEINRKNNKYKYQLSVEGEIFKFICNTYNLKIFENQKSFDDWMSNVVVRDISRILRKSEKIIKYDDMSQIVSPTYSMSEINSLHKDLNNRFIKEGFIVTTLKDTVKTF